METTSADDPSLSDGCGGDEHPTKASKKLAEEAVPQGSDPCPHLFWATGASFSLEGTEEMLQMGVGGRGEILGVRAGTSPDLDSAGAAR